MTVEAVCFESEHKFLESKNGQGCTCRVCHEFMATNEFRKRIAAGLLVLCDICDAWHMPDLQRPAHINYPFAGRDIKITDMKNGTFVFETNRDESGYVTAKSYFEAVEKIEPSFICSVENPA